MINSLLFMLYAGTAVMNMVTTPQLTIDVDYITRAGIHVKKAAYHTVCSSQKTVVEPVVEDITVYAETTGENTPSNNISANNYDLELIALVTMAEAEGESEYGQRLVIDTILNRVDSDVFPNTISEVLYQPNQFTCVTNGRLDRCYVKDEIYQLVLEEMECRTNYDVLFFTAGGYGAYGTPLFQEGNHYFTTL